ncbi:restriction endonuclease [Anabaena sp. WFMT]|uniref:restriction endonuclease n=1 Tax=Anabaena sp. WFMT TaxID=3449730 RepID=UPI003F22587E
MTEQDLITKIRDELKTAKLQSKVFELLSDQKWHCRKHEGKKIGSDQYAGGGGIQGLEQGNRSGRRGLVIETKKEYCEFCKIVTKWDRWTGERKEANAPANITPQLVERILKYYSYIDVIEHRERYAHELVIDHRFPKERWGANEPTHSKSMSDDIIQKKFQLLKNDTAGNHNLLKSRSCERCIQTGKRGTPFGIKFYYQGDENWTDNIPKKGKDAEKGCIGFGWYDMEKWRNALNQKLTEFVENQEK